MKTKRLNAAEKLDMAIKNSVVLQNSEGYFVEGKDESYKAYQPNNLWLKFKDEMKTLYSNAFEQYGKGGGGELEEKNGKPPKMASYASSSRMIYLLARNCPRFEFEKKLPTTAGGTANLDGYLNSEKSHIFIEAKCREPYNHSSSVVVGRKYEKLYNYLNENFDKEMEIEMSDSSKETEMKASFNYKGKKVDTFDIKQMISHLCGIATACIKGKYNDKPIEFLYLLYNPCQITDDSEILSIYKSTCEQCKEINFKALFSCIIDGLIAKYRLCVNEKAELDNIKNNFTFSLCDQNTFKQIIFR